MVRRTKEEAQETRARILDAAEQVFYDKGVANASLEEIAAAAQLTRGAIYWHFKDKAELFDAMMCRVVMPAEEML
jgi:TetR/AcrR family acrAB operon transcriptional repressor